MRADPHSGRGALRVWMRGNNLIGKVKRKDLLRGDVLQMYLSGILLGDKHIKLSVLVIY